MDKYTVINENFGQGSYGKVALVRHIESGEEMVWKQTNYGGMNDKEKQQLINEVNILRELKHENIVRCYDKFVDKKNTSIYLVMEYCKGGDLGKLIQKYRQPGDGKFISEDQIWRIFTQVVLALYECHRRKNKQIILHRDLKPSNIFLDENQNAKLGDFGFARALQSSADGTSVYAKTYLGSPYYMSPEQCNGQEYNEKSDIWSLGIILYEMAQLNPPFMATNQLTLALKIKEGRFKRIPSRYSEELMRVIQWMLQVEPHDRPNVEDLLNLPHVSMRLRERALKRNLQHMKRKEEEVIKKEAKLRQKAAEIEQIERELKEREKQVLAMEQQVAQLEISVGSTTQDIDDSVISGYVPPATITNMDSLLDDSDLPQLANDNLVVRRVSSIQQPQTSRSRLDNTAISYKSSELNKIGVSISSGNHLRISANSYQISPPRQTDVKQPPTTQQSHDYTEIMGYKNINISRDVDQSYMLKGGPISNRHQDAYSLQLGEKQLSTGSNQSGDAQAKLKSLTSQAKGYYTKPVPQLKTNRSSQQAYLKKPRTNSLTTTQEAVMKSTSSLGSNAKPRNIKVVRTKSLIEQHSSNSEKKLLKIAPFLRQSYESVDSVDMVNPCLDSQSNPLQQVSQKPATTTAKKQQQQSLQQLESLIRKSKLVYASQQEN